MQKNAQNILADKHVFVAPSEFDFECLKNCLVDRIHAGQGECFLEIGVGEGQEPGLSAAEMNASVATVQALAELLDARLIHLRDRVQTTIASAQTTNNTVPPNSKGKAVGVGSDSGKQKGRGKRKGKSVDEINAVAATLSANATNELAKTSSENTTNELPLVVPSDRFTSNSTEFSSTPTTTTAECNTVTDFLLRKAIETRDFVDIRVAVVGNVDAGKSTMLGVLTHGELDNGRGLARQRLFRHKHEMESGRTSSVANDIMGFDVNGKVVNRPVHGKLDWSAICQNSAKVITFIDLAGHERYLKTTVFGLTGHAPDYVMLMVGANAGVVGMTKEHLGLALALSVPVFVVITKVDMCPPNVLNETVNLLFRILKSPGCRKIPVLISTHDDVVCSAINFSSERMCPVFLVSNVTGLNLELLTAFLNLLSPRSLTTDAQLTNPESVPAEFQIDELFTVPGVGSIVSGTCLSGVINVNDVLNLGPNTSGAYIPVLVKSIQRKRMTVAHVKGGQTASFSLKRPKGSQLRRGMVLLSRQLEAVSCIHFSATVLILHHPTTISVGYQAMVHAGPVRQTATILSIASGGKDHLRTGDKADVHFEFIKHPEYLRKGLRLIFREGKTKAVGTVIDIVPYLPVVVPPVIGRSRKAQQAPVKQAAAAAAVVPSAADILIPGVEAVSSPIPKMVSTDEKAGVRLKLSATDKAKVQS